MGYSGYLATPRSAASGCRPRNLTGLDIQAFLRHLLRHLRGPVDLLWDRGPIHRRREVRAFLAEHPRHSLDRPRPARGRRVTLLGRTP
jgi:hypothetical protein